MSLSLVQSSLLDDDLSLFESIANNLVDKGYSISLDALPKNLASLLLQQVNELADENFKRAGIGRAKDHVINDAIRTDEICWITGNTEASGAWIKWAGSLQNYLNKHLFLGLFSFESHFSHYGKGDFYKQHKDAFKGEDNRVLSVVVYLNQDWSPEDGGELIIYPEQDLDSGTIAGNKITVIPNAGTIVVFLSEEFPHEVLPALRDRYAIAGWFRLNTSIANNIDPPR